MLALSGDGSWLNVAVDLFSVVTFGYGARAAALERAAVRAVGATAKGTAAAEGDGPVVFRPGKDWTPEEHEQLQSYVDAANRARDEGALSPTGRVSTKGDLRVEANEAAREERARAAEAGTPYQGQVGHAPDTTWTGKPDAFEWHDQTRRVNSSLGAQARQYPEGYKPTEFKVGAPRD
jgi:hypothetical protein